MSASHPACVYVGYDERLLTVEGALGLPFVVRSDPNILFDDSKPMETVNRQLIRAKLNYAEVSGGEG